MSEAAQLLAGGEPGACFPLPGRPGGQQGPGPTQPAVITAGSPFLPGRPRLARTQGPPGGSRGAGEEGQWQDAWEGPVALGPAPPPPVGLLGSSCPQDAAPWHARAAAWGWGAAHVVTLPWGSSCAGRSRSRGGVGARMGSPGAGSRARKLGLPGAQGSSVEAVSLDAVRPPWVPTPLSLCPQGSRGDPGDAGPRGESGQPGPKVRPYPQGPDRPWGPEPPSALGGLPAACQAPSLEWGREGLGSPACSLPRGRMAPPTHSPAPWAPVLSPASSASPLPLDPPDQPPIHRETPAGLDSATRDPEEHP